MQHIRGLQKHTMPQDLFWSCWRKVGAAAKTPQGGSCDACPRYGEGQEWHHNHQGPRGMTNAGQDGKKEKL